MKTKAILAFLVAILAVTITATFASAAPSLNITGLPYQLNGEPLVYWDGLRVDSSYNHQTVAVVAGQTYPVTVDFRALENADNVEISAWIQGERQNRVDKVYYDLIAGGWYRARLNVPIDEDINFPDGYELTLYVRVESDSGNWEQAYTLLAQREAHNLDVLLVDMDSIAKAGSTLGISVVLENMGRHEEDNTLVTVRIPELGISRSAYYGDLYPADTCTDNCEQYDSGERKIFLTLPEDAKAGTYNVEITAFSDDTETKVSKVLKVVETEVEGKVIANPSSKTFAVGEEAVYDLVLVNTGDKIAVFNLAPQASDALSVSLSESIVSVPAGSSETIKVYATANREGTHTFTITADSGEGFAQTAKYSASVQGKKLGGSLGGNNLIVLTIVLAIIFVVLVVILAVLLTRKPQKSEEFGESYY